MRLAWLMLLALLPLASLAHESRPGYLEIQEVGAGRYDLLWKVPRLGELVMPLRIALPNRCRDLVPATRHALPGGLVERRSVDCGTDGLAGQSIGIDGLRTTITDVLVRVTLADGASQTLIVTPDDPVFVMTASQSALDVARNYTILGIEHILSGIDHLLFVLGLMLLVRGLGLLVRTITAFTLAHSITLGAAALGFVHVPQAPVEAVIALSILFLATELLRQRAGNVGLAERYPWLIALSFGLLHGFGFAGALSEVGLPETAIPMALLSFNVGVEIGQLMFVAAVLAALSLLRRLPARWPAWTALVPTYGIGSLAAFWCIQRIAAF
jgi:hypothetical protein